MKGVAAECQSGRKALETVIGSHPNQPAKKDRERGVKENESHQEDRGRK